MEEPVDERRQLYERFKAELAEAPRDIFFDEKELVEIYDQAGDMDDDHVKLEVLLHGFRLYPDSEELAVRRGYFYYNYNVEDGVRAMWKNRLRNAPLWEIIKIRMLPDVSSVSERLAKLLDETAKFDDEEIIQFVDCASSMGEYEWLKSNFDKLRSRCGYMPTLLYEMQIVASINNDSPTAIKMLEELTEIEPFNADFWTILAEEQLKNGNAEDALSTVEYAIAVAPEDPRPVICKARALVSLDRDSSAVTAMLEHIKDEYLDDSGFVQLLGVSYANENRFQDAIELLSNYQKEHPDDRAVTDYLLLLHYEGACDALDAYYAAPDTSREEKDWADWARHHHSRGHFAEAALILECYDRNSGIEYNKALYFSALYAAKFYKVILHLFEYYMQPEHRAEMTPEIAVTAVMSYVRMNRKDEAIAAARVLLKDYRMGGEWSVNGILATFGALSLLNMIATALESEADMNIDDLDPFGPPAQED